MKKSFKSFALVFLLAIVAVMPLLAGCSKTFTVDVSITGGNQNGGYVTHNSGYSVYGKNAIDEGENFVFTISSKGGYYISDIKVDGVSLVKDYNIYNYEFSLSNVRKDTSVEVTFEKDSFVVELFCTKESTPGFDAGFEAEPYKLYSVLYGDTFKGLLEFGVSTNVFFYYNADTNAPVYINTLQGINIWTTGKHGSAFVIYTNKTAAELDALLAV